MGEVATVDTVAAPQRQYHTSAGHQIVVIDGRLTYLWSGAEPLAVGDQVMVPENWLSELKYGHGLHLGTVTSLGSTYTGELSTIVRRATDDDRKEWCLDESEPTGPKPMHPDPEHRHQVRWNYYDPTKLGGPYTSIDVNLDCGCEIHDIRAFAADMREQKGWDVAVTVGWSGGWNRAYTVRVRSNSLYGSQKRGNKT